MNTLIRQLRSIKVEAHYNLAVLVTRHVHGRPATAANVQRAKHTLRRIKEWLVIVLAALVGGGAAYVVVHLLFDYAAPRS
jgi:hypothetical protein